MKKEDIYLIVATLLTIFGLGGLCFLLMFIGAGIIKI